MQMFLGHLIQLSSCQNFLYASKDDNSPLKVIDFGLSDFVRPGELYLLYLGIDQVNFIYLGTSICHLF